MTRSPSPLTGPWPARAMSLYCSLVAEDFEDAVVLAVNHSGDSDRTGAITGNILGATLGTGAIPQRWRETVELRGEILRIARDMVAVASVEGPDVDGGASKFEHASFERE